MKEATVVFGEALHFIRWTSLAAITLVIGCGKNDSQIKCDRGMESVPEDVSFRYAVEALTENLSRNENGFRQSAYRLCCDIRKESDMDVRRRLIAIYTNAIPRVLGCISRDCFKGEEGLNKVDVRLRNSWHLTEWGTAALFDLEPGSPGGWDYLIAGVSQWRDALAMIDKSMLEEDIKSQWRNRLQAFKRHLASMYESKFWGLGKTYWSLRRKMTQEQRQDIRKTTKRILGELPPEMAKDEQKLQAKGDDDAGEKRRERR